MHIETYYKCMCVEHNQTKTKKKKKSQKVFATKNSHREKEEEEEEGVKKIHSSLRIPAALKALAINWQLCLVAK